LIPRILITAVLIAASSIFIQWWCVQQEYDHKTQQTAVFSLLCFVQLMNALSVRSMYEPILSRSIFANRGMWVAIVSTVVLQLLIVNVSFLQTIFKTAALPWSVILTFIIVMVTFIVFIEMVKFLAKRKYLRGTNKNFTQ
jgi:Ca2+-transporting ATPase